jgi:uncharacterized protein
MPWHELDFLATQIVFCPHFRLYQTAQDMPKCLTEHHRPKELFRWKVRTPQLKNVTPFCFRSSKELSFSRSYFEMQEMDPGIAPDKGKKPTLTGKVNTALQQEQLSGSQWKLNIATFSKGNLGQEMVSSYFEPASSQQLLRVRMRLGDLCNWTSTACESAITVAQCVEHFMNAFFPGPIPYTGQEESLETVDWVVETVRPSGSSKIVDSDSVTVPIERSDTGKWIVDSGMLDAVISLWMAGIEAGLLHEQKGSRSTNTMKGFRGNSRKAPDWRRRQAETGMRYIFLRILGDDFEDGVLQRDLSWWSDEQVAELINSKEETTDWTYVETSKEVVCVRDRSRCSITDHSPLETTKKVRKGSLEEIDIWGRAPIHIATWLGHEKIASLLLDNGANIDQKDKLGHSPVDYALAEEYDLKDGVAPEDDEETENPGRIESCDAQGNDSFNGKQNIFMQIALMNRTYKTDDGQTLLHRAIKSVEIGKIKILLQAGYDIEACDSNGRNAFHLSLLAGRARLSLSLLRGIQLDDFRIKISRPLSKDQKDTSPLMFAAETGLKDVIEELYKNKHVEVNNKDFNSRTALHYTLARNEHPKVFEIIKVLVKYNYNPTIRNTSGKTVLYKALNI